MHRTFRWLAFGIGLTSSLPAFAACVPKYSNFDEIFGAVQLGQSHADLPEAIDPKVHAQCVRLDNSRYDCDYQDKNGVRYTDDGDGVLAKDWAFKDAPPGMFPFGLTDKDTVQDVLKKTAPYRKFKYRINRDGVAVTNISSGFCYRNGQGKVFSLSFSFLNGTLYGIHTSVDDKRLYAEPT